MRNLLAICLLLLAPTASANATPEALHSWKEWLLDDHPQASCPYRITGNSFSRQCIWAESIEIEDHNERIDFKLIIDASIHGWVQIPGDHRHWPQEVKTDETLLAVTTQPDGKGRGEPGVWLDAGRHRIHGNIPLAAALPALMLPPHHGIIKLRRDGRLIAPIELDQNNLLRLRQKPDGQEAQNSNSVQIKVFRRLIDSIPTQLETRVELAVSGSSREMVLGQLLPEGAVTTRFDSKLPARIDPNGQLRTQLRAGQWVISSRARYRGQQQFGFKRTTKHWPEEEIWAFAAQPELRGVKVSGAASIDPSQLGVPPRWRQLPTYRLKSQQQLTLEELYRGAINPPANQLTVRKTLWLDFDGNGVTVEDHLSGRLNQGWRLSAQPSVELGRARSGGMPQVITALPDGSSGVEVRNARIDATVVARLRDTNNIGASGWQQPVDSLAATLQLPPGWLVWHIAGPDQVHSSWLSRWNLWDIFVCLLLVATTTRLLGRRWAALTVTLLALLYHQATLAVMSMGLLLISLAILRVLPAHRLRSALQVACFGIALMSITTLLSFAVDAMRQCLYPQLEYPQAINTGPYRSHEQDQARVHDSLSDAGNALATAAYEDTVKRARPKLPDTQPTPEYQAQPEHIQTGPGLPTWRWQQIDMHWSGPVAADEQVRLYLSPPLMTRLLRLLQVLLLGVLVGRLLKLLWQLRVPDTAVAIPHGTTPTSQTALVVLAVMMATILNSPPASAAENFPPADLLEEYQKRLLAQPECQHSCFAVPRVKITAGEVNLRVELEIAVAANVGIPLPRFSASWQPQDIQVDGKTAAALFQDRGQWYLLLDRGVHQVIMNGRPDAETLKFHFTNAHYISVDAPGWAVAGLQGNRLAGDSLTLHRKLEAQQRDSLLPEPIAPFIEVHRHLLFDQSWQVSTTVRRLAPRLGSLHAQVPLLEGERVQRDDFDIRDGVLSVSLKPDQTELTWLSSLPVSEQLTLTQQSPENIVEHWSLKASPRWRIEHSGLTPTVSGPRLQWRPNRGEKVELVATRPEPVAGPNTTVEAASWRFIPGQRSSIAELELTILSSIGRDYPVQPPTGAALESLQHDGVALSLPKPGKTVQLPLHPGSQTFTLRWRLPEGVALLARVPTLKLGSSASNIDLEISLPHDRWPLLVGGPPMGPAMLFWGTLFVMLLVALLLGRVCHRMKLSIPLHSQHWLLLILGLSTVNAVGSLWIFAWFFALEARQRMAPPKGHRRYNLLQSGLILLSLVSAATVLTTIPQSLLSYPDMQVTGNGSSNYLYRWYQDHSTDQLPAAWVFSVPIWVYRATMLLWSLWLVFAMTQWLRWGWQRFCDGGAWRKAPDKNQSVVKPGAC